MKTESAFRGTNFWVLTLVGMMNIATIFLRMARHRAANGFPPLWEDLPFITMLMAIVVIWVAYMRLQSAFLAVSQQVGDMATRRLQSFTFTLAFMGYLGISAGINSGLLH